MTPIYLDNNASTPLLPEVVDAMLPYLREHFGNPSSSHVYGKRAKAAVEEARAAVASLIGATPEEIFFTSGGTEANNTAIRGVASETTRRQLVTTQIEHPATTRPCEALVRQGFHVTKLGVDAQGVVRLEEAAAALSDETALVTVIHANNETGVIQPLGELSSLARAHGVLVHADAAQSLGKIPVDVRVLGVDLLSIAGHKLYAPKGVGALYVRAGARVAPFMLGAGHERGFRAGTENVASLVGLGVACTIAQRDLTPLAERLRGLRERLWEALRVGVPGLMRNGHAELLLPNTLNVSFPGVAGRAVLEATPEVAASTGSACHDGADHPSAVLMAMGVSAARAIGSVRLSLGRTSHAREIDGVAQALIGGYRRCAA